MSRNALSGSSNFQNCLKDLENEHKRHVQELYGEIENLRQRLSTSTAASAGETGPISVAPMSNACAGVACGLADGKRILEEGILSAISSVEREAVERKDGILSAISSVEREAVELEDALTSGSLSALEGGHQKKENSFTRSTCTMQTIAIDEQGGFGEEEDKYMQLLLLMPPWLLEWRLCGLDIASIGTWWAHLEEPRRSGCLFKIVNSRLMTCTVMFMILANTAYIVVLTDRDMHRSLHMSSVEATEAATTKDSTTFAIELFFMCFYIVELVLKFSLHRLYFFVSHADWRWNLFDTILVTTSLADFITGLVFANSNDGPNLTFLRVLRLLKVARILRMFRVVKFLRELRLMLEVIINSISHLVWSLILIMLILLLFSLVIVQGLQSQLVDASPDQMAQVAREFDCTSNAMVSLFMATTGGADWGEQYALAASFGTTSRCVYLSFIAFFTIVAWNTVMGSFMEKACRLAMPDLEAAALEKHNEMACYAKELTRLLTSRIDVDQDGMITLAEFRAQLSDKEVVAFFLARDINVTDAEMFFQMLSSIHGTNQVDIPTFTKAVLRMRGGASGLDMQTFHYDMKCMQLESKGVLKKVEDMVLELRDTGRQPSIRQSQAVPCVLESPGHQVPNLRCSQQSPCVEDAFSVRGSLAMAEVGESLRVSAESQSASSTTSLSFTL